MLVLRVENKDGHGPWSGGGNPFKGCETDHFYEATCPDINDDLYVVNKKFYQIGYKNPNLKCGLQRFGLYENWFHKPHQQAMLKAGYMVSIYKIHKNGVRFGVYQCAFDPKKGKILKKFKPDDLEGIKKFLDKNS